jgi:hypothetical protein
MSSASYDCVTAAPNTAPQQMVCVLRLPRDQFSYARNRALQQKLETAYVFATQKDTAERAAAETSAAGRLRFSSASPQRSCDGGGRRALSSHASRIAGVAERENGTAVYRLSPAGTASSPRRSQHVDCHRSTPSRRSVRLAPRSRPHNHQAERPFPLPTARTSRHAYRLPEKGNRQAQAAACYCLDEKDPQDSRGQRLQRMNDNCQVTIV